MSSTPSAMVCLYLPSSALSCCSVRPSYTSNMLTVSLSYIPHRSPISRAVSPLSPVSIQTLIPANLNSSMHLATSSCSRSSTPVTPHSLRLFSFSPCDPSKTSPSCISRAAKASVRSPSAANLFALSKSAMSDPSTKSGSCLSYMAESDPFANRNICSVCTFLTTTDIILRSELNSYIFT